MEFETKIDYIAVGKSGENLERYVKGSRLNRYEGVLFESMPVFDEAYIEKLAIKDDRLIVLYGELVSVECKNTINLTGYDWPGMEPGFVFAALAIYGVINANYVPLDIEDFYCISGLKLVGGRTMVGTSESIVERINKLECKDSNKDVRVCLIYIEGNYKLNDIDDICGAVCEHVGDAQVLLSVDFNRNSDDDKRPGSVCFMTFA